MVTKVKLPIVCPSCGKKLGEHLEGLYETTCPRCKKAIVVDRRDIKS